MPHLDLVHVSVDHSTDDVEIVWTLAGAVPATTDPVEYRVSFTHPGTDPVVVLARLGGGDTPFVAVGTCRPHATRPADCTDRPFDTLTARPQVHDVSVVVTVPSAAIGLPLDTASWTAEVLEPR